MSSTVRHCEKRSDEATQRMIQDGAGSAARRSLCARNDSEANTGSGYSFGVETAISLPWSRIRGCSNKATSPDQPV